MTTSTVPPTLLYLAHLDSKAYELDVLPVDVQEAADMLLRLQLEGAGCPDVADFAVHCVNSGDATPVVACSARLGCSPLGQWHLTRLSQTPNTPGAGAMAAWKASDADLAWFVQWFGIAEEDARLARVWAAEVPAGGEPSVLLDLTRKDAFTVGSQFDLERVVDLAKEHSARPQFDYRYWLDLDDEGQQLPLERFPRTRGEAVGTLSVLAEANAKLAEFRMSWVSPYDDVEYQECGVRLEREVGGAWHLTYLWCRSEGLGEDLVAAWELRVEDLLWYVRRFGREFDGAPASDASEEMKAEGLGPCERLNLTRSASFVTFTSAEREEIYFLGGFASYA